MNRLLTVALGLSVAALVGENLWLYWHVQEDTRVQEEFRQKNEKAEEDLVFITRAAEADRSDFDLSYTLCEMRNQALVLDLDKCSKEIEDVDLGICVPPSVYENVVEDHVLWKRDYEEVTHKLDMCRRAQKTASAETLDR